MPVAVQVIAKVVRFGGTTSQITRELHFVIKIKPPKHFFFLIYLSTTEIPFVSNNLLSGQVSIGLNSEDSSMIFFQPTEPHKNSSTSFLSLSDPDKMNAELNRCISSEEIIEKALIVILNNQYSLRGRYLCWDFIGKDMLQPSSNHRAIFLVPKAKASKPENQKHNPIQSLSKQNKQLMHNAFFRFVNCLICWNTTLAQQGLVCILRNLRYKNKQKQQELQITQTKHYYDQFYLPVHHSQNSSCFQHKNQSMVEK